MNKLKTIAGLGLVSLAAMGTASADALDDLTTSVSTVTGVGTTVVGVTVTLFLVSMAMRFFRKGARG